MFACSSLSVKSLYEPVFATVDSSKTFLAEAASAAVITPTIGAVDEPVPPFWKFLHHGITVIHYY